jgi:hypothetical protein
VNSAWLSNYRSWIYGGGFGLQIGLGITTYVMTAAVPLMMVIGALTASPRAALAIGAGFGLTRGLAVLLGARVRNPEALYAFHRRFDSWNEPVRKAVIAVELAVAVVVAWIVAPPLLGAAVSALAVSLYVWQSRASATANLVAEPGQAFNRAG